MITLNIEPHEGLFDTRIIDPHPTLVHDGFLAIIHVRFPVTLHAYLVRVDNHTPLRIPGVTGHGRVLLQTKNGEGTKRLGEVIPSLREANYNPLNFPDAFWQFLQASISSFSYDHRRLLKLAINYHSL